MGEMTAGRERILEQLNALIAIDYDAIEAYKVAVDRLHSVIDQDQLRSFLSDHRRHVADLSTLVTELHGTPVTEADFKRHLTKGKVVLGAVLGDRAVLDAMNSNEESAAKSYQKAATDPGFPTRIRLLLERNLADERRQLAWLQQRLAAMATASAHR